MSEWKTYKWGDLISLEYGKPIPDKNLLDGQYPVYGTNGRIGTSNLTPLCKHPSIIVGRKGAYRGVHYSNKPFSVIDTAFFVEPKTSILDLKWAYYKLLTVNINKMDSGSAIPSTDRYEIYSLSVELPSLDEQRRIAGILGSLDDKIELNRRINANLEAQAQALFRSWFVDFEPFRDGPFVDSELGKIPNDFQIIKTGEIPMIITDFVANGSFASLKDNVTILQEKDYAYFIRNVDLKDKKFETYVNKHAYEFLSKSALFGNEIIISNVGDVGSVFLCPKLDRPMTLGNNIIMLRPKESQILYYLYIWFKWFQGQSLIQGIKSGSAQPKFNKTDFKNLPIILPPRTTLRAFHSIIEPFFNKINFLTHENQTLSALRDTLLPKLMAGEIKIRETY